MEGILQRLNTALPPSKIEILVDENGMSLGTLWMNGFWSQCQLLEHLGG